MGFTQTVTHLSKHLKRKVYENAALPKRLISVLAPKPVLLKLEGFKIFVRLDDWAVGARLALKRTYEPHVTGLFSSYLKPGMVIVDIGANIGFYSLLASSRVGKRYDATQGKARQGKARQGKVISFEPSVRNCVLLQKSVDKNGFDNVFIHNLAVSDQDGVVGYVESDSNGNITSADAPERNCQVRAIRLDTFLAGETRIDIVKMDIEGAEALALKGMQELIRRCRPVIFSEFWPAGLKAYSHVEPRRYLESLSQLGYEIRVIDAKDGLDDGPQSMEMVMRRLEDAYSQEHLDLLALPRPAERTEEHRIDH